MQRGLNRMRRVGRRGALAIILTLLAINSGIGEVATGWGQAQAAPPATLLYTSAWPLEDAGLRAVVNRFITNQPGRWSILIKKLDTGQYTAVGESQQQVSASLYKLFVLYEVFRQWDKGTLRLDEQILITTADTAEDGAATRFAAGARVPISRLLNQMIAVSDNTSAAALIRRAGFDNINRTMQEIGLTDSRLDFVNNNTTTAADMADLLERIALGRAVSQAASRQMLDVLLLQEVNDLLPQGVPAGTDIAHKTGTLTGLRHDAAIIYGPSGPYLFVAMASGLPDPALAYQVLPQLSAAVYRYFNDHPSQPSRYYPLTGQWVASPFLRVWNTYDGPETMGDPIGPEQVVDGYRVQWFERARLGLASGATGPEQVEFGSLGREVLGDRRFDPVPDPGTPGSLWVRDTGQVMSGAFLDYWQQHGGVRVFGNPISPVLNETLTDGTTAPVQYFEHARFELRGDSYVVLTPLGRLLQDQP